MQFETLNLFVYLRPTDPNCPNALKHALCMSRDLTKVVCYSAWHYNVLLHLLPWHSIRLFRVFDERDSDANLTLSTFRHQTPSLLDGTHFNRLLATRQFPDFAISRSRLAIGLAQLMISLTNFEYRASGSGCAQLIENDALVPFLSQLPGLQNLRLRLFIDFEIKKNDGTDEDFQL